MDLFVRMKIIRSHSKRTKLAQFNIKKYCCYHTAILTIFQAVRLTKSQLNITNIQ